MRKSYPGINIQWPISQLILDGKKLIETRTYCLPEKYIGVPMALIETPGPHGNFKSRVIGLITFSDCFNYKSKASFLKDFDSHLVDDRSPWAWKDKSKWGWRITKVRKLNKPIELKKRNGIVFTSNITI